MTRDKITQELVSCPPHEEKCHTRSSCTIYSKIANTLCRGKKHLSSDTDGRLTCHGYDIRNETHHFKIVDVKISHGRRNTPATTVHKLVKGN